MADAQYAVLAAIGEAFVPTLTPAEINQLESEYKSLVDIQFQVSTEARQAFYKLSANDQKDFGKRIYNLLVDIVPSDKMARLNIVLRMLNTSIGTWLICGGGLSALAPFPQLKRSEREAALNRLNSAWIKDIKQLFRVFGGMSLMHVYGTDLKHLQVLKLPPKFNPIKDKDTFEPKFLKPTKEESNLTLSCDVVIVGSGCGGGLMAAELAADGYDVIIVERGTYKKPSYDVSNVQAQSELFLKAGGLYSEDMSMQVLAANTFGGGSAVNWSASLPPPQQVREEWNRRFGLKHVLTEEFQESIDTVWNRIGCSTSGISHNVPNRILLKGCEKLGYDFAPINQNTTGKSHECGDCGFTCSSRIKQSSVVTWIQDASKRKCRIIEDCLISKILHRNNKAYGVEGNLNGKPIKIKSKYVVVSCGSMGTPALLLRSQFSNLNKNVGKNLKLHPVTVVNAIFPDREILPSTGSIMTSISNIGNDLDGEGYGYKLEIPMALPFTAALMSSWKSGVQHKRAMMLYPHTATMIILIRDKDSIGNMWIDSSGETRYNWKIGSFDGKSAVSGIEKAVEIFLAAGAREIALPQTGITKNFIRDPSMEWQKVFETPEYKSFIEEIRNLDPTKIDYFSAHQMSSCRMASTPAKGAVDEHGRLYGVKNLYISDASVFPTSSGVK